MSKDYVYSITSHHYNRFSVSEETLPLAKSSDEGKEVRRLNLIENPLYFIRIKDPEKKDFWKRLLEKFTYVNFKVKDKEGNIKKISASIVD